MVTTAWPSMSPTWIWQERTAVPSTCTVQAPHKARPQPNLVPVMPTMSRRYQSRGVSGSPLKFCALPLTVNLLMAGLQGVTANDQFAHGACLSAPIDQCPKTSWRYVRKKTAIEVAASLADPLAFLHRPRHGSTVGVRKD